MIIDHGYITMIQSAMYLLLLLLCQCVVYWQKRGARFHFHHKVCAVIQIVKKHTKIVLKVIFGHFES
jgi:uncharacterized membrane protein